METVAELIEKEKDREVDALNAEKLRLQQELDALRKKGITNFLFACYLSLIWLLIFSP